VRRYGPLFLVVTLALLRGTGWLEAHDLTARSESEFPASSQRGGRRPARAQGVYKADIRPHWFAEGARFWYRNDLPGRTKEFILVDAEAGERRRAFDHARLAQALSEAAGEAYGADRLPFDRIELTDDVQELRFRVDGTAWVCDLTSYTCSEAESNAVEDVAERAREVRGEQVRPSRRRRNPSPESPDGRWTAVIRENNVFVRARDNEEAIRLSTDGAEGNAYGLLEWAPDSQTLVAFRIEPGEQKEVYLIESSPRSGGRARLHRRPYALPGDRFAKYELNLFHIPERRQIKCEVDRFEHQGKRPQLHFSQDGSYFTYEQVDRGHQRLRVIKVHTRSGDVEYVIDEQTDTFIWTAHTENLRLNLVNWLEQTDEIIYVSEMDGWRHLYLADAGEARIVHPITQGPWVVRGINRIDEDARQIWFHASGKNPDQDPYFVHYYRVDFDGSNLVALTEGDGTHAVQYSPDRRYLIDTYSRVDLAPVHTLRRVCDGRLVCELERADISELTAGGWEPPEVFVAKGRDGKTDIWGIICRPRNFDPNRKYPVIESLYAGPQSAYVPKRFSAERRFASLTDRGFIVVQIDGMGTAHRSKAFHDVCWKNLKDAGFPDRILWHQAVARKYSHYDLDRLGVYGNSAGGQSAAGAVLFHPQWYKAAVASCGCHDNRLDKASWNEQWMGYPVGPQYAESSNIEHAHRLEGELLLIVGEMDRNVPPESTMRFVDALIKADKDFDLLVIPGGGHGMGAYARRRMEEFFVRHLLGE